MKHDIHDAQLLMSLGDAPRTLPVIVFKPTLQLTPERIVLSWQLEPNKEDVTLKVCFNANKGHITGMLSAQPKRFNKVLTSLNSTSYEDVDEMNYRDALTSLPGELQVLYNIDLDVGQAKKRLVFSNNADKDGVLTLTPDAECLQSIPLHFTVSLTHLQLVSQRKHNRHTVHEHLCSYIGHFNFSLGVLRLFQLHCGGT